MTIKDKATCNYSKYVFLVCIPVYSHFQGLVEISEFKPGLLISITFYNAIHCINLLAFKIKSITTAEKIRIIISKKIDLSLFIIEVETILRFRHQVNIAIGIVNTCGST